MDHFRDVIVFGGNQLGVIKFIQVVTITYYFEILGKNLK